MNNKEKGHAGVIYAAGFVCIISCCVLFVCLKFIWDLYIIAEQMETGLHISESAVLSSNYKYNLSTGDMNRYHIITAFNADDNNLDSTEINQINNSWMVLKDNIISNLGLTSNGSLVANTCRNITIGDMIIYEPVYSAEVIKYLDETGSLKYNVHYNIVKWIKYTIELSNTEDSILNQSINSIKKEIIQNDDNTLKMYNNQSPEGATIEASLYASFSGVNNIFARIGDATNKGYFTDTPSIQQFRVKRVLQMDIVIANQDSRFQEN